MAKTSHATIQSTMIRASAGSGKTYQLANRFLALLVLGVPPEKIIALTFTRKAAGEFAGRIMTSLAEGASSNEEASALSGNLTEMIRGNSENGVPGLLSDTSYPLPTMDREFFQGKLADLIDSLHRLSLSTLDSYFVRIVRNFALELGLHGFDLMEDSALSAERLSAMVELFSSASVSQQERENFLQSFKQATWGKEENRLSDTLEKFISDHQYRWLSAPDAEVWGGEGKLWPNGTPYTEGNIPELADRVIDLLGEPRTPHKSYMKGWVNACHILSEHKPGATITLNAQLKRALPAWTMYAEGQVEKEGKDFELGSELGQAMTHLLGAWICREIRVYLHRTQGLHAVISGYEQIYRERVRKRGRLCFSEVTLMLAGQGVMAAWDESQRALIDFRLDARYDHWLLDEFQDTSMGQWKAVGGLIDEVMQDDSGERSLFVVGDSKQSIYGWRGGEPRLFDDLQRHYGGALEEWMMDVSYRSTPAVLDLVNTICDLSQDPLSELFPAASIARWNYNPHRAAKAGAGHALVIETPAIAEGAPNDSDARRELRYAAVRDLLEKIQPLTSRRSCAVLVRKNAHATELVSYLREHLPDVPVAADSDAALIDGPMGSAMLDLFRWLAHPGDSFALKHLQMSPLYAWLENDFSNSDEEFQPAGVWSMLSSRIAYQGLAQFTATVVDVIWKHQEVSPYGTQRLRELVMEAERYADRGGSLSDWVSHLESVKLRERTHEGGVQVMTVHKSKGLGFDTVILPDLDVHNPFDALTQVDLLENKGEDGAPEYLMKRPFKELSEADSRINNIVETWKAEQCYERFCNLYVALTRAKTAIYCVLDGFAGSSKKFQPKRRFQDWFRVALDLDDVPDEEIQIGETSYPMLYEQGDWLEREAEDPDESISARSTQLPPPRPRLARRVASQHDDSASVSLSGRRGRRFGNLVHDLFEQVEWLDETSDLSYLGQGDAADLVRDCLNVPEIRSYFIKSENLVRLLREQAIETHLDGQWLSGVVDRALMFVDENGMHSISIIDYKTDRVETMEELTEKHREQLQTYARAMSQITGVSLNQIRCCLISTSLKLAVEFPAE